MIRENIFRHYWENVTESVILRETLFTERQRDIMKHDYQSQTKVKEDVLQERLALHPNRVSACRSIENETIKR